MRVEFEGLDELIRDLRKVDTDRVVRKAQNETEDDIVRRTQSDIKGKDIPQRGIAAQGVVGRVAQGAALIELEKQNPIVRAVVFGTRWHWLWGTPVLAETMTRRVFPEWVGARWEPEDVLDVDSDDVAEDWLDAVFDEIRRKALD